MSEKSKTVVKGGGDQKINVQGGKDAGRNVIMGNQLHITYAPKMPGFEPPQDLERLKSGYLQHLRNTHQALDFKGIPQLETS